MSRIANVAAVATSSGRTYRSELRERQAEETRTAILDATVRVMARGIVTLSVPEVAREAGVSVPTVYRHFGTKQDLVDAVYPHLERRAGRGGFNAPIDIADLRAGILRLIEQLDAFDDVARAVMASPAAEETRRRSMPRRTALIGAMVDTIEPPLPKAGRDRIVRLMVILGSSAALRTWRDHLGRSPEEVAEEIEAIIHAAIAAERERAR